MKLFQTAILCAALTIPFAGHAATVTFDFDAEGNSITAKLVATGSNAWDDVEQSESIVLPHNASWATEPYILPNNNVDYLKISPDGGDPCRNACSPFYGGVFGSPLPAGASAGADGWENTEFFTVFDPHDPAKKSEAILTFERLQQTLSLLWGSPDRDNAITLLRDSLVVGRFSGDDFSKFTSSQEIVGNPGTGVALLELTSLPFDRVIFSTLADAGSFEFSNLTSMPSPVPLPPTLIMLLSALGMGWFKFRRRTTA